MVLDGIGSEAANTDRIKSALVMAIAEQSGLQTAQVQVVAVDTVSNAHAGQHKAAVRVRLVESSTASWFAGRHGACEAVAARASALQSSTWCSQSGDGSQRGQNTPPPRRPGSDA